jgi:hypothetical protein
MLNQAITGNQPKHTLYQTSPWEICLIYIYIYLYIYIFGNPQSSFENEGKPFTHVQKFVGAEDNAPVGGLLQLWQAFTAVTSLTCSCGQKHKL